MTFPPFSDVISYSIIGLVVFVALAVGRALCAIAPEELKPGKKNLVSVLRGSFIAFHLSIAVFSRSLIVTLCAIGVLLFFVYKLNTHVLHNNNCYLVYTLFGAFLGSLSLINIIYPAIIAFVTGMILSVLMHNRTIDVYVRMFVVFVVFYVGAILLIGYAPF